MMITYREYLEMFELTPEGHLRFDILLDLFMELGQSPRESEEDGRMFRKKLCMLKRMANPEDLKILKSSEFWRRLDLDSG